MTGIGTYIDGDSQPYAFHQALNIVVPPGSNGGTLHRGDQHMAQVIIGKKLLLLIRQIIRISAALLKLLFVGNYCNS